MQNGTTGVAAKPADFEANPQNAPATTPRDKGKGNTKTAAPAKPAAVKKADKPAAPAAQVNNAAADKTTIDVEAKQKS